MSYLPPEVPVTNNSRIVSRRFSFIRADCAGSPCVRARLFYREDDPYAITMVIDAGPHGRIEWRFARDLLAEGLVRVAGIGDVRIHPAMDVTGDVIIQLNSPDGQAALVCSPNELSGFLRATFAVVAMGAERAYLPLDAALAELLRSESH